jgi:hypothetical protein
MHHGIPEARLDIPSTVFLDLERERPPAARRRRRRHDHPGL